jgi:CheY-like chemotaxis protein
MEPLRILLIEDNLPDAELLERELRREGLPFSIRRVETRESFEDALNNFSPDLILSDSDVPALFGSEALALVRECAPHIPFIFVSGAEHEGRKEEALRRGATDYILKGRNEGLVAAINRALDAKRRG